MGATFIWIGKDAQESMGITESVATPSESEVEILDKVFKFDAAANSSQHVPNETA